MTVQIAPENDLTKAKRVFVLLMFRRFFLESF